MKAKSSLTWLIGFLLLILLPAVSIHAAEVTCFLKDYTREKGKPVTITDTYYSAHEGTGTVKLTTNGDVTSAVITLNGQALWTQKDFKKKIMYYEKEATLLLSDNKIEVYMAGKPGAWMQIGIVQTLEDLMDGAILHNDEIPIQVTTMEYQTDEGPVTVEAGVGRVIVQFNIGVPLNVAWSIITSNGGEVIEIVPGLGFFVAKVSPGGETAFANLMRQNPLVAFAEIDLVLSEAQYTGTPFEGIDERPYLTQVNAPKAWEWLNDKPYEPVPIGIIDSGFKGLNEQHGDFNGRLFPVNAYTGQEEHGTIVTAIAAAAGNTTETCGNLGTGIVPCSNIGINWTSEIVVTTKNPLPVMDLLTLSIFSEELFMMVSSNVKVINISSTGCLGPFCDDGTCQLGETASTNMFILYLSNTIERIRGATNKDFIVVNAAGNEGCYLGELIVKPKNLIIVGGSLGNERQINSNYGEIVDIAAPFLIQGYYSYEKGTIVNIQGTSVAAPQVTGAAALVWSYEDENLTADQVVQRLKETAQGSIALFDGAGVLDVYGALDSDEDSIPNALDNCLNTNNPEQIDSDGDNFGAACDCDDTNPDINPNASEICDGIDNNCDGSIDEGLTFITYYRDADLDGYGDPNDSISGCHAYLGYVEDGTDCDDNGASIHPGVDEICGDGIDQDCNGSDFPCGPELPLPPTGLSATYDSTNNRNWITWNSVSNADSYNLYWGTEPGVTKDSEDAGNTLNTEFSHTGVMAGWTYYYRVSAVNSAGESDLSDEKLVEVPNDFPVNFPDSKLESAIREKINKPTGPILVSDLQSLSVLTALGKGIRNLEGLEYCTNLTWLWLPFNNISDISPLASLTNLTMLLLYSNNINDISSLASLTNLTELSIAHNNITDISPLASLTNLTELSIDSGSTVDLSLLASLTRLNDLEVYESKNSDISLLANLINLKRLVLRGYSLTDINPLVDLVNLTVLGIINTSVEDISPLANIINLNKVTLAGSSIVDISPVANLENLNMFWLQGTGVSDIKALVDNPGISGSSDYVILAANPLSEISCNQYIPELESRGVDVSHDCPSN